MVILPSSPDTSLMMMWSCIETRDSVTRDTRHVALVLTWQMSAYPQLNTVLSRKKVAWLPRRPHRLMMKGALQAGIWDRGVRGYHSLLSSPSYLHQSSQCV